MMKNMYRNDEALTIRLNMPGTGKTVTSDPDSHRPEGRH